MVWLKRVQSVMTETESVVSGERFKLEKALVDKRASIAKHLDIYQLQARLTHYIMGLLLFISFLLFLFPVLYLTELSLPGRCKSWERSAM